MLTLNTQKPFTVLCTHKGFLVIFKVNISYVPMYVQVRTVQSDILNTWHQNKIRNGPNFLLSSPPPLNLIVDYLYKHILYYLRITVYVQALKSVIALRFEVPWAHTLDIAVSCLSLYISLGILEMLWFLWVQILREIPFCHGSYLRNSGA